MTFTLTSHHVLWPSESWLSSRSTLDTRSGVHITISLPSLSPDQIRSLHIASVTAASLSLLSGILTTYWFFRMRRSYRHDLIMLLIGSDMFQACWFITFPVVELVHGTVASSSKFCQANGFLLTLSLITSDVAIMLVTIHTALYIFRGEQGLYPFRKYAYTVLALYPVLMSSLAFLNKPAYINTGQFCYLPVNPTWVRFALSWVPRYVTFATILSCSLAIYIYVRVLMRRFKNVKNPQEEQPSVRSTFSAPAKLPSGNSVPPTPSIDFHGFGSPSLPLHQNSKDDRVRQYSVSTMSTLHVDSPTKIQTSNIARGSDQLAKWRTSQGDIELAPYVRRQSSAPDLRGTVAPQELAAPTEVHMSESQKSPTFSTAPTARCYSDDTATTIWRRGLENPVEPPTPSLPNIYSMPSRGLENTDSTASDTRVLLQPTLDATGLVKTRETIRRQVKQVFIYPVVYIAVWALPFIVHLTSLGPGVPFGVRVASVCCLCLHGLIDAAIFSWKEKPWLHTQVSKNGFNFERWRREVQYDGMNTNAGRTREEMMKDGRLARQRREREMTDRQQEGQVARKGATEWWEGDV